MAKVRVTVCDECSRVGVDTKPYRIVSEGRSATVDLCADHAGALEALLGQPKAVARVSAPPPRKAPAQRRTRPRVTTLAEIEKAKKKR